MSEHVETLEDGSINIWWDTPEENPNHGEKGQAIAIQDRALVVQNLLPMGTEEFDRNAGAIIDRLHTHARAELGPGVVYEIRGKIPNNYGRGRGMAWYTCAWMQKDGQLTREPIDYPGKLNELGGYMFLGRFKT